jgi:hypothetical protein
MSVVEKRVLHSAWALSIAAAVTAIIGWGQGISWHLGTITVFELFPLLGLLAFSLMWSHYIAAVIRMHWNVPKEVLHTYFEATSLIVLIAIFLHPGLLAWGLWRNGLGLPPGSYKHYVAPALKGFIIFGQVSLLLFLAYELRHKFSDRSWWKYIGYGTDIAMLLIFIHALRLGTQLQTGWLRDVWYVYGFTLVISLVYIHGRQFLPESEQK